MDRKTMGWIKIIGGVLAILFAGGNAGYGMMGYGYGMMSGGNTLSIAILGLLFIISGVHHISDKK